MDSHMAGIQRSFQVGLVALPSWAQSQSILEVVAITAGIEAVVHELLFITEVSLQSSAGSVWLNNSPPHVAGILSLQDFLKHSRQCCMSLSIRQSVPILQVSV